MPDTPRRYVFLLRCWQEPAEDAREGEWRFMLEEVYPQKRWQGFDSLAKCLDFLRALLAKEDTG